MIHDRTVRGIRVGGLLSAFVLAGTLAAGNLALAQGEVSIEVIEAGAPATPIGDGALANPVTGLTTLAVFAADQWTGGGLVTDSSIYGRPAAALYAQSTGIGTASLSVDLGNVPTGDVILTLVGLDDDAPGKTQIEVTINKASIYKGDAWFEDWGGKVGEGNWTTVQITIPKGMFGGGVNDVTVSNMSADGHEGEAPYILLGAAQLEIPGVDVEPIALG